jgi:predicted RNase H-like HicB family nuclease
MSTRSYAVFVRRDEDLYLAECPEVGTTCHGSTIEEAIANLREATEVCLKVFSLQEAPLRTSFETARA